MSVTKVKEMLKHLNHHTNIKTQGTHFELEILAAPHQPQDRVTNDFLIDVSLS